MNYAALTAELAGSHPVSGAYAADAQAAANQINAANISQVKASMTGRELWASVDMTEYKALTPEKKTQWISFTNAESIDPSNGGWGQQVVVDIFGTASSTVAALAAARNETVSRAMQLGLGRVRAGDIERARS